MFLSNGFQYAVEFSAPKHAFYHLYQHLKWCYDSKDNLDYGVITRILAAFLTPHFLYKLLLSIKWQPLLKNMIIKIPKSLRGKNSDIDKELNESTNTYSHTYQENANIYKEYREGTNQTHIESVQAIKQLLMQDIEKVIEKRLHDIFLAKGDKPH